MLWGRFPHLVEESGARSQNIKYRNDTGGRSSSGMHLTGCNGTVQMQPRVFLYRTPVF